MERVGLRLQLRKQQAEAGDIVLLYGDESEALTHPYLARAWAKAGADLRVPAPGQAKKVAMLGSLDHVTRQLIVHTSPTKRSSDFIAHLEQLDRLYGPQPGRQAKPVVLTEDNGPIHTSKCSLAALVARAHWLTVEWLPKYAPELNDIEPVWRDLKAHHLAHQTFTDAAALDQAIHDAVTDLNRERIPDPLAKPRILLSRQRTTSVRVGTLSSPRDNSVQPRSRTSIVVRKPERRDAVGDAGDLPVGRRRTWPPWHNPEHSRASAPWAQPTPSAKVRFLVLTARSQGRSERHVWTAPLRQGFG